MGMNDDLIRFTYKGKEYAFVKDDIIDVSYRFSGGLFLHRGVFTISFVNREPVVLHINEPAAGEELFSYIKQEAPRLKDAYVDYQN